MIKDKNLPLKKKFLEYFKQLPIQKLAADYINRSEDTITDWKKDDQDFSDQIASAKSEWALKKVKGIKSKEWLLERLMKDHFSPRSEITGKEGEAIYGKLTDEQIDRAIESKLKQIGALESISGKTKTNG